VQRRGEAVFLQRVRRVDNSLPAALNRTCTYVRIIKPDYFKNFKRSHGDGRVNEGMGSTASYLVLSSLILTSAIIICFLVMMSSIPVQAAYDFAKKYRDYQDNVQRKIGKIQGSHIVIIKGH
jgi:hypothetical protein